jgi:hypothetical protein
MDPINRSTLAKKILIIILLASFCVSIISYFLKNNLPGPTKIDSPLFRDPIQETIEAEPISADISGVKYSIEPKYNYELWGLVVSINDNEVWYSRFKNADPLNTKDICVIWGDNLKNGNYQDFKFRSEEFVCIFSSKKYMSFNEAQLSNNHLLYADDAVYKQIRSTGIGDQIHLKGYLSNYSGAHNDGQKFSRSSSFSRTDTGDGACETVYVREMDFVKKNSRVFAYLYFSSEIIAGLSLLVLIIIFLISLRKPKDEEGGYISDEKTKKDFEQVLPPSVTNKF